MVSLSLAAASGIPLIPVAAKAVGEVHRQLVLQSNGNNTLARQGNGTPSLPGIADTVERQRAGGISSVPPGSTKGGAAKAGYLGKVPSKPLAGDDREHYKTGLGNATSSRGRIVDILSKVPKRTVGGSADYKKANRATPSRAGGFGNQSFTP